MKKEEIIKLNGEPLSTHSCKIKNVNSSTGYSYLADSLNEIRKIKNKLLIQGYFPLTIERLGDKNTEIVPLLGNFKPYVVSGIKYVEAKKLSKSIFDVVSYNKNGRKVIKHWVVPSVEYRKVKI